MQNDTCYILALFKRDDGERLLLGSGFYEFDKGQKHFNPNTFANDIVELQGADGQLLAGQVRRSTSQSFDGVIGDGTTSKATVEQKRREFFLFFRKQHHYTVVYIFPDGSAIKRDRGYITDAPAVQELYQVQPKWHIALAFEDVNYYSYAEDAQGNEIYSYEAELGLANIADGGLVWDAKGATSDAYKLNLVDIKGDTFQQTYTGKNLLDYRIGPSPITRSGLTITEEDDGTIQVVGVPTINYVVISGNGSRTDITDILDDHTTYTLGKYDTNRYTFVEVRGLKVGGGYSYWGANTTASNSFTTDFANYTAYDIAILSSTMSLWGTSSRTVRHKFQLEKGGTLTTFEKYVGGQPSPNPEFPQSIQKVAGSQTITIHGTNYPLDLGTIELNKVGTYQDRIYKDGANWKLHKATTSETLTGGAQFNSQPNQTSTVCRIERTELSGGSAYMSDRFTNGATGDDRLVFGTYTGTKIYYMRLSNSITGATYGGSASTIAGLFNSWLSTHNVTVISALETATDTTITDASLIAQLDAIEEAMAEYGKPTAIVPTGQNLAVIITGTSTGTGGYVFAPSTGGGPIIVTVNGVDDANPVWHVYGPATNPTLTNSTTGEALTWNGTVPANQELIIDMGQQTATLEGANVFEYVSGSWVQLAPGQNRISYTAANTTRSSKVFWNEVVG